MHTDPRKEVWIMRERRGRTVDFQGLENMSALTLDNANLLMNWICIRIDSAGECLKGKIWSSDEGFMLTECTFDTFPGKTEFDDWSIDLCVLSVCQSGHFFIQTIAISVLIELLGYTLCLTNGKSSNELLPGTNLTLPDNISIIPSFNQEQVALLINETLFFQHITAYLWEYLSDRYERQYNLKASRILSMLHSMLPNCDCEDLICNQLSSTHIQQYENELLIMEAYKRFFKLWNSTRDISIVTYGHLSKTFERCLLIVISVLNESNNHCLKSIVQQWTCDCFVHGKHERFALPPLSRHHRSLCLSRRHVQNLRYHHDNALASRYSTDQCSETSSDCPQGVLFQSTNQLRRSAVDQFELSTAGEQFQQWYRRSECGRYQWDHLFRLDRRGDQRRLRWRRWRRRWRELWRWRSWARRERWRETSMYWINWNCSLMRSNSRGS